MSLQTIYLVGPVIGQGIHGMQDWRQEARGKLEPMGYRILSPLTGEALLWPEGKIAAKTPKGVPQDVARAVFNGDRARVEQSDILLCNFKDAKKVSIGSLTEIVWGFEWKKMIVLVANKRNCHLHPWVKTIMAGPIFAEMRDAYKYLEALSKEFHCEQKEPEIRAS